MTEGTWVALIGGAITTLIGTGGVVAYFTIGPSRRKIVIDAAEGAVVVQSGVLKNLEERYDKVCEELSQIRMELITRNEQYNDSQKQIRQLQTEMVLCQREMDRQGCRADIASRKHHLIAHAASGYELLIDNIFTDLRTSNVPIKAEWRSTGIRTTLRNGMEELEELESHVMNQSKEPQPKESGEYSNFSP